MIALSIGFANQVEIDLSEGKLMKKIATTGVLLLFVLAVIACNRIRKATSSDGSQPPPPVLEITPLEQARGQWKVAATDSITVTVTSPGAEQVRILGRPADLPDDLEEEYQLELRTLGAPTDSAIGKFVTRLNLAPDFVGEIWAEALYPGGVKRQTEAISLTAATAIAGAAVPLQATGGSVGTDESARSDKLTGGRIVKARLRAGGPDIRITVNLPAFLLTLWQNGKEIRTYHIGIGRKSFPVPIGEREASAIIFNPNWIPPDSAWVRRQSGVEPYERINAGDPRNPLGKVKIPLGAGYLIHEAAKEEDIGRAVSHGCIRMRRADLFDLAEKIIVARSLPVTVKHLYQVKEGGDRLAVPLDSPLLVDINYDLQVVEGGVLHLYPDVYERGAFMLDSLRAELQSAGVDISKLDEEELRQMLDRVGSGEQFVISVADIRRGRLNGGRTLPLTERLVE